MGEFAQYNGERVKIGTCEEMLYLRFEDRFRVDPLSGNVNPRTDTGLYFRLPFPDEDQDQPGGYKDPFRGCLLYQIDEKGRYTAYDPADLPPQEGTIQLTHPCGLLVNVTCHHGRELPTASEDFQPHWNGRFAQWFELESVKVMEDHTLCPVFRCRACRKSWRSGWDEILPFVPDDELRRRLTALAAYRTGVPVCA